MKDKRQKLAILSVGILLVFSVITGLVKPYIQNKDKDTVGQNNPGQEKVFVPNFQFTDKNGNTVDFDNFKGKPVVINFWGTWCPWCIHEMGDFDKAVGEYKEDVNFIFLDVANGPDETVEKVEKYLTDNNYDNITTYYDTLGYNGGVYMFGINSFPTTVYIDREGALYDAAIGATNYEKIKTVLDSML